MIVKVETCSIWTEWNCGESQINAYLISVKAALSGLRQFLPFERPLQMMKSAFYFTLKSCFVLKVFKFLSLLFDYVEKQLD